MPGEYASESSVGGVLAWGVSIDDAMMCPCAVNVGVSLFVPLLLWYPVFVASAHLRSVGN